VEPAGRRDPVRQIHRGGTAGQPTRIDLGFPATFIRDHTLWVFGAAALEGDTTTLPGR
jgi:hypothetical protein